MKEAVEIEWFRNALPAPPDGWRRLEGALTQPCGYDWYCNGKSRWSGEYKHVLVAKNGNKQ